MTDTSNADNSPDAGSDATPFVNFFRRAQGGDANFPRPAPPTPIWQRGPRDSQPTTVAAYGEPTPPDTRPPPGPLPGQRVPRPGPPPRDAPIPPNLPQPPRRFDAYIPAAMNPARAQRQPSMWGLPEPFAPQPQPFEAGSILQGFGRMFGGMGSGMTIPLGRNTAAFAAAYIKAYSEGKSELAKQQLENLTLHSKQLEEQQQEEADTYADVVNTYSANGWKPINGVTAEQAMEQAAGRFNDTNMLGILHSKGIGGAYQLIQSRDSHWQDGAAANKSLAKEQQDAKDAADWGLPGASQPTEAPGSPIPPLGSEPLGPPAPPPDPNAPAPSAQPVASQPETQKDRVDALQPYQRAGIAYLRGDTSMTGIPKIAQPAVRKYADDTLAKMDALVAKARAGGMSKEEIEQGLRDINPAIAGEFADIRDLNTPLPGGMGAINAHPFWRDIDALATASVPGWRVADYQQSSDMQKDYTTGTSSRRMQAANNMADAAVPLLKALRGIPEGQSPPKNWIDQQTGKLLTGDPQWVRLYNAIQAYVQESQSLASPTGRFNVTDVDRLMGEFNIVQGPRAIRAIIATDADAATRRIESLTSDYSDQLRGRTPPHFNRKSMDILKTLATLDPDKGFGDRKDLPPDLQGLGMGLTGGGASDPTDLSKSADPDADYEKLPSGALFIGPDGKRRRKP